MRARSARLGLASGVGLVAANMIGSGVFLSAGYMAQTMGPGLILAAWIAGMALALAGARAYAEVAQRLPRSGGEYRYLSELLHPAVGYVAGWASLLVGFAAPVAINALGAAGFLGTIVDLPDGRVVATALIVGLTAIHAAGMSTSRWTQDVLAWLKVVLVLGFVALGLALGAHDLPDWARPDAGDGASGAGVRDFIESQFYIAYAFSGWNAAIYVAEEFRDPRRDVARSMLLGCLGVGLLYLGVNFVLVANVTPEMAAAVIGDEARRTTLGHIVAARLVGDGGATVMSILAVLAFVSAASAMTYVGPRIFASMARDGFLPRALAGREGRPPTGSVVVQGAVAVAIVWLQGLHGALQTVGALLTLFAALTCVALFKVRFGRGQDRSVHPVALLAAAVYVVAGGWMLSVAFRGQGPLLAWTAAAATGALATFALTRWRQRTID